jgi:hypothetical protein
MVEGAAAGVGTAINVRAAEASPEARGRSRADIDPCSIGRAEGGPWGALGTVAWPWSSTGAPTEPVRIVVACARGPDD